MVEEDSGVRRLRVARVADIVLLDHPADATGPRSINCYLTEVPNFTAAAAGGEAKKFRIVPQRLLYSLRWKHNGSPSDFNLQLVRDPAVWFDHVGNVLLDALAKHDPTLRDRLQAAAAT